MWRVEAVDPYRQRLATPIDFVEGRDQVLSGRGLLIGWHTILDLEHDDVGSGSRRRRERGGSFGQHKQLAAIEAGGCGGDD